MVAQDVKLRGLNVWTIFSFLDLLGHEEHLSSHPQRCPKDAFSASEVKQS